VVLVTEEELLVVLTEELLLVLVGWMHLPFRAVPKPHQKVELEVVDTGAEVVDTDEVVLVG
jgi:hypothetical protein